MDWWNYPQCCKVFKYVWDELCKLLLCKCDDTDTKCVNLEQRCIYM